MKILITGGAGFVGSRLARRPARPRPRSTAARIERLVLADQVAPRPELTADKRVETRVGPLLGQCEALGTRGLRRRLPPRLGGVGRVRGRLRPRPALQPRHHAGPARRLARRHECGPAGRQARLLQLGRGVRARAIEAAARSRRRRHPAGAEDLVRHAQADVRVPDRRLFEEGLHRRPLGAADDGDGAAGPAERRRLVVLLRDHPRAARRRRSRSARCRPDGLASADFGGAHGRGPDRRLRGERRAARRPARAQPAGASTSPSARCSTRSRQVAGKAVRERVRFVRDEVIAGIVANWSRGATAERAARLGLHADTTSRPSSASTSPTAAPRRTRRRWRSKGLAA